MNRILLALGLALAFTPYAHASSLKCPNQLAISVDIGQVALGDADDADFIQLSHSHLDGVFELAATNDSCVMVERLQNETIATVHTTTKRRYLEIKKNHLGTLVTIDTYTSSGKLYSITSQLDDENSVSGSYDANVVERSGLRRHLGQAQLKINELE